VPEAILTAGLPPVLLGLPLAWFANPLLLWGLGAASIPILIHLLNRRRFREEKWAAMRFLLAAIKKNQRRIKIEQWLLLLVRTAILAFLALAMARPVLEGAGVSILPGQRTHWVLVLDGSLSMSYKPGEETRFAHAKRIAERLIQDSRTGDAASLLLMGDPPRVIIGAPAIARDAVRQEISGLEPTDGTVDLAATFQKIDELLAASDIPRKEVVFLTDLQAASWRRPNTGGDDVLKKSFERLEARHARSQVIDLGTTGEPNRAVTDISISPALPTVGAAITIRATIKNHGTRTEESLPVRLALGDRVADETTIRIGPGEEQSVAFAARFTSPGESYVVVGLPDDRLRNDDVRRLAVPVRESLAVLLVDGDPKNEAFRSETDFLAEALDPETASPGDPRPIRVTRIGEAQLARRDLTEFDVVICCNVARYSDPEVAALEAHLKQGGGLVLFGGDQVQADSFNRLLFNAGKGIAPAELGAPEGDLTGRDAPVRFNPLGFRHPIVAAFAGQAAGVQASLVDVKTLRYHRLVLPKDTTAQVALAFTNDAPAIVVGSHHRGRVVQLATSASADWTTWPLHRSFVPVMEQIVAEAASGRLNESNVRVGQPLSRAFPAAAVGAQVTMHLPERKTETTALVADGDTSALRFAETGIAGAYGARVGPPLDRLYPFAVNPDPIESDLSKLDETELRSSYPAWKFVYDSDWRPYQESASAVSQRGELHRPFLWAVLVLLLVETVLAFWFGHHANPGRSWRQELLFLGTRVLPAILLMLVAAALVLAPAMSAWIPQLLLHILPPGTVAPPRSGEALTPHLRFEQPWGQLALAITLVFAALLVVGIYRREGAMPALARAVLTGLRVVVILLAVFLLAQAVLQVERTGLPYFVVMLDDSASSAVVDQFEDTKTQTAAQELAKSTGQSEPTRLAVARGWLTREDQKLWKTLEPQHRVKVYGISNQARPLAEITESKERAAALAAMDDLEASGDQTRLGDALRQVLSELRGANPTAILLLSDGQTTEGESLTRAAELARQKGVPLFTLGLGDPMPPRDLELADLQVDEVVFVDDLVRFDAKLLSRGFAGEKVTAILRKRPPGASESSPGEEIDRKVIDAPPDGQSARVELVDRPKQTGSTTYTLELEPKPRELKLDNNRITREIQVREERLRVLLVDTEPRYEFRALKNFLEREKTIDLDVLLLASDPEYAEQDPTALGVFPPARDGEGGLFHYDVILLGDADPDVLSESQMQNLSDFVVKKGGGLLFIAGQAFNPLAYARKPLELLLPVQLAEARDPVAVAGQVAAFRPLLTVEGRSNPIFRLGESESESLAIWETLPPLFWYFEAPRKKPAAFVLAEHPERGGPEGKFPLSVYQYAGSGKVMLHAFDDTWRWRFRSGDRYFGRFWIQTIRFLARNRLLGEKQAEILTDRKRYSRNQPIAIQVRFLNPGLAPSETINVELARKGAGPKRLPLRRSPGTQSLFEAVLPQASEGDYQIRLLPPPVLAGALPTADFRVDPPAGELEQIRMNESELRRAASLTGGEFLTPTQNSIDDLLKVLPDPQKVPLETDPPISLWNTWPLLFAFVLLITAEWVFRKRKQLV
jgi:uncharacterized membrane protein